MARPPKIRRVECLPIVSLFKPVGLSAREIGEVTLSLDELEALRLKDYEGLEQEECAVRMQISRPTFQRILVAARKKVAAALVEGHVLRVEGGNYQVVSRKMECEVCRSHFEVPCGRRKTSCPECGSRQINCLEPCQTRHRRCCGRK